MIRIEHTIDVEVSTSKAYSQWTQYESYPLFMENVKEVSEITSDRLHWRVQRLMEHSEAIPFDSGSPRITGVEYSHHVDVLSQDLLTNTPGSPTVPTPKKMSKSPDADGKDNRIDLDTNDLKASNLKSIK